MIENLLRENLARLKLHPIFRDRLVPKNAEQEHLTKTWIIPNTDDILADMRWLRNVIDQELFNDPKTIEELKKSHKEYPYGLCKPIRDRIFTYLKKTMEMGEMPKPLKRPAFWRFTASEPLKGKGIAALKNFVIEGGIIQPFWGIDKGIYFQNAIQIGTAILDGANDTVDAKKEPVILYEDSDTAPIKRIESFTEFASVAEGYWKHDVYPNIYFPALAPVFPLIGIEPVRKVSGGVAHLLLLQTEAADLGNKNLFTRHHGHLFGLASHFLFHSPYSTKRLSSKLVASINHNETVHRLQKEFPEWFAVSEEVDASRNAFAAFNLDAQTRVLREHHQAARRVRDMGLRLRRVVLGEASILPERGNAVE